MHQSQTLLWRSFTGLRVLFTVSDSSACFISFLTIESQESVSHNCDYIVNFWWMLLLFINLDWPLQGQLDWLSPFPSAQETQQWYLSVSRKDSKSGLYFGCNYVISCCHILWQFTTYQLSGSDSGKKRRSYFQLPQSQCLRTLFGFNNTITSVQHDMLFVDIAICLVFYITNGRSEFRLSMFRNSIQHHKKNVRKSLHKKSFNVTGNQCVASLAWILIQDTIFWSTTVTTVQYVCLLSVDAHNIMPAEW